MQLEIEVIGKFEAAGDCAKLLYVPPEGHLTYRRARRYVLDFEGSEVAAKRFIDDVLVDHVSHDVHLGTSPALSDFTFHLDYGMKPTALDHEKETILGYHAELEDAGFTINALKVTTRIYVFDEKGKASADPFVRDIVNPAVHVWNVSA
ncbi:MAG: hypothetical protein ACI9R3_005854 [Verrucomicrobiales bacterium]|jgi:hypothetical protein